MFIVKTSSSLSSLFKIPKHHHPLGVGEVVAGSGRAGGRTWEGEVSIMRPGGLVPACFL